MAKLPGVYEYMATVGAPAINFGRGLLGYQDPFLTQTMQDRMAELEAEKGPTGNVGYEDYGLETATPGGRFTGGLMGLALNNPVDFGLAGSVGRYSYSPQGRTGLTYDFTPDQDTGTTGNAMLDFINRGGVKGAISKMGTAQAAEVTPTTFGPGAQFLDYDDLRNRKGMPIDRPDPANAIFGPGAQLLDYDEQVSPGTIRSGIENFNQPTTIMNEPLDIEDFLGTSTPQDLGFIGNAPSIREAVAPVGITDRGRGMPGAPTGAYEMIGGTPVAVGDVLGMQQALEKADFYEEPSKRGIDLGLLGMLAGPAGFLTGSNALKGIGMLSNIASGRTGRAFDAVSKGLGSIASKVRGGGSQADYDRSRSIRQSVNRLKTLDKTLARQAKKANVSQVLQDRRDRIANEISASRDPRQGNTVTGFGKSGMGRDTSQGGGDTGGGRTKIVCTMMNDSYGFGNFRNKIWLKHSRDLPKEYEVGYHTIFLPLVKFAKGEGKLNKVVKKTLEHIAKHRTYDLKQEMKGKTHLLGRAYRKVLEPICYIVGKASMFTRRG